MVSGKLPQMPVLGYLLLKCSVQVMRAYDTLVLHFGTQLNVHLLVANPLFCYNTVLQTVSHKVGCQKVHNVKVDTEEDDFSNINKSLPK